jgi:outer membrane receptor protein involved in Fe transport
VSGIWGKGDLGSDGHNFYLSAEYRQQNRIGFADRGGLISQTDFTSSGGYNVTLGVPNDLTGGLARSGTGYITDPKGHIVGFMPGCNATTYAAGQCTYKDTWSQIQPPTKNYNVVGRFTQSLASDWEVSVEGAYLESKDQLEGGPVRAFTGGYQGVTSGPGVIPTLLDPLSATTIPSTNPSFPAGTGLTVGNLRYTLLNLGPTIHETDSKSYRAIADLNGKVGTWGVEFSAGFTEVKLDIDGQNYAEPATLQAALDSTTAPFLVGQQNSSAVNNFVAPPLHTGDSSKLSFAHIGTNGDVYDLSGGKASPKIGFKFTPIPEFALRGTASKGFRAPGPAQNGQAGQTYFAGTSADPILCKTPGVITAPGNFAGQCNVAVPTLQGTNPHLQPETSKSFTLGFIVEPFKDFSATLDLYSIEIDNQIVSGGPTTVVRGNNLTPLPEYLPDGTTALVTPPAAPITYQTTSYINAHTTKTDGADVGFALRHRWDGVGEFKSQATWSFTRRYDLTIDGITYNLAGTHGPSITSGDTGTPKSRVQWSNTFARGSWQVTGTLNYISSFDSIRPITHDHLFGLSDQSGRCCRHKLRWRIGRRHYSGRGRLHGQAFHDF